MLNRMCKVIYEATNQVAIHLSLIVEDLLSEAVARKMLDMTDKNYQVDNVLKWNKNKIQTKIRGINKSAQHYPFFVLTDQDTDNNCPPNAIRALTKPVHSNLLYRFAVMEIESWVMAHREAMARFLSISLNLVPLAPDTILQPKEHLIGLAKKSRSSRIRQDIVPSSNSSAKIGPDYNGVLSEFIEQNWNVDIAAESSPSLKRTMMRLRKFSLT